MYYRFGAIECLRLQDRSTILCNWKKQLPPNCLYLPTIMHGFTSQEAIMLISIITRIRITHSSHGFHSDREVMVYDKYGSVDICKFIGVWVGLNSVTKRENRPLWRESKSSRPVRNQSPIARSNQNAGMKCHFVCWKNMNTLLFHVTISIIYLIKPKYNIVT
jgi:hypothetical protein